MTQELNIPVEVLNRLDALAAKVGASVDHLWPALVKYEYWCAMNEFFAPAALIVAAALAFIAFRRSFSKDVADFNRANDPNAGRFSGNDWSVLSVVCLGAFFIFTLAFLVSLETAASSCAAIFSPEAAAIRSLLGR